MIEAPRQQQLCGEVAEVSVHALGSSLAAEMEHLFPDAPHKQNFLAAITFQFPAGGIDLALDSSGPSTPQVGCTQRHSAHSANYLLRALPYCSEQAERTLSLSSVVVSRWQGRWRECWSYSCGGPG